MGWDSTGGLATQQLPYVAQDWFGGGGQTDSASTTPAASAGVAAVRWFGLLANDASREAFQAADVPLGAEGGFLGPEDGQNEDDMTPLQRATRIIDNQPPGRDLPDEGNTPANPTTDLAEEGLWEASENICLLGREQVLFENFLHRICPWVGAQLFILLGKISWLMAVNSLICLTLLVRFRLGYHTSPSEMQVY